MNNPMACDWCGAVVELDKLAELKVRTLGAICWVGPARCEPAEYATSCPDCGEIDSFQPAVVCAECGDLPCSCLPECV